MYLFRQFIPLDIYEYKDNNYSEKFLSDNVTNLNGQKNYIDESEIYQCQSFNLIDSHNCNLKYLSFPEKTTNATNYNGRYRLNINKTPSLSCNNDNDKFTVSNSIGNGELTYPIGLLTADEVSLAGGVWNQESIYYLQTGSPFWTMTPSRLNNVYPSVFVVLENGSLYAHSGNMDGIRPSIVLKSNTIIKEGNGTKETPYIVK